MNTASGGGGALKLTFIIVLNMSTAAYHNGSAIIGLSIAIY